jgi:porin
LLDDQYTAELFYRLQLTYNLAITPDVQLIIDPALNPDENRTWVFGLRARLAL